MSEPRVDMFATQLQETGRLTVYPGDVEAAIAALYLTGIESFTIAMTSRAGGVMTFHTEAGKRLAAWSAGDEPVPPDDWLGAILDIETEAAQEVRDDIRARVEDALLAIGNLELTQERGRTILAAISSSSATETPCVRGDNDAQGIGGHWCTVHDAEFLLSRTGCSATETQPEPWVHLTDPDAGPCTKCGHSASGIKVGGEERPHTCCDHPDCMTSSATETQDGERPGDKLLLRLAVDALSGAMTQVPDLNAVGMLHSATRAALMALNDDEAEALAEWLAARLSESPSEGKTE